jgi:hypothetical protein
MAVVTTTSTESLQRPYNTDDDNKSKDGDSLQRLHNTDYERVTSDRGWACACRGLTILRRSH